MPRCTSVISLKNERPKEKEWKIKKTEIPGPGQYKEAMKAFSKTVYSSPIVKFKTGKRKIFAEAAADLKSFVPAPNRYDFKEFKETKLWRRITTKR